MIRETRVPVRMALAAVLALGLAGCGSPGGEDAAPPERTGTTTGSTADTGGPPGTTTPDPDDPAPAGSGDGAASGRSDLCQALPSGDVAAAAGLEVVEAGPYSGFSSLEDVEFRTAGCRYEFADDGSVEVTVVADPDGRPMATEVFDRLESASAGRTISDTYPHETVSGLGTRAFFQASLLGNELFVDTGAVVLYLDGDTASGAMPRTALRAVAAAALDAVA